MFPTSLSFRMRKRPNQKVLTCGLLLFIMMLFIACGLISGAHSSFSNNNKDDGDIIPEKFFKHLQGPPDEFKNFVLPSTSRAAITSDSYLMDIEFTSSSSSAEETSTRTNTKRLTWRQYIPVDTIDNVTLSIVSKYPKKMNLKVLNIEDLVVNENTNSDTENEQRAESILQSLQNKNSVYNSWIGFVSGKNSIPTKTFVFNNRKQVKAGDWLVEVSIEHAAVEEIRQTDPDFADKLLKGEAQAFLLAYCTSPISVHSQLNSYRLSVGEKIGFTTRVIKKEDALLRAKNFDMVPRALPKAMFTKIEAEMDVEDPDGKEFVVPMQDQADLLLARSDSQIANIDEVDGVFSAQIEAKEPGFFSFRVVVKGIVGETLMKTKYQNVTSSKMVRSVNRNNQNQLAFMRTTQHTVYVVDERMKLLTSGTRASFAQLDEMLTIDLQASVDPNYVDKVFNKKFKAYTEVWAHSEDDESKLVPVCWVMGMTVAKPSEQDSKDIATLPLQMSMTWLSKANAKLPLVLKNTYIRDVETSALITQVSEILQVETHQLFVDPISKAVRAKSTDQTKVHAFARNLIQTSFKFNGEVTETMTMGKRPVEFMRNEKRATSASSHKVLLVHGYCSSGEVFPLNHFQNAVEFSDPDQSRSNDKFAQLIWDLGKEFESFAIVAHSQGGLAALHLLTFYWSNADKAPPGVRLIQSVGSPYLGTSLAGSVAELGKIFKVGCGKNMDLTVEGAVNWLNNIPPAAQEKVYFYTTQYKDWSWCSLATQSVLNWPNDGTTEYERTALPKGNNQGHKKKYCHTTDMNYPPQCKDPERNAILNKYANGF
ncbi:hypothetical protein C9374_004173 [Naegleria lovaniensis]|uniref:Uncharacterized protein n=1 Tax=Naegleria lovaniensis TaxID=51637 RepID=A0AA88GS02_NAELO|nr:uncharacterized protein C9374_004173 [Naegleria lovaniensis]KAG2383502.1 hypothetical protein C9374_004173 [Naegleria lovaniensis]